MTYVLPLWQLDTEIMGGNEPYGIHLANADEEDIAHRLVHTANAYPRLVEAVQTAAAHLWRRDTSSYVHAHLLDLLRDLGESEGPGGKGAAETEDARAVRTSADGPAGLPEPASPGLSETTSDGAA